MNTITPIRSSFRQCFGGVLCETNGRICRTQECIFVSFFSAFLHSRLSPTAKLGITRPPAGIIPFNPLQFPLLNAAILLASGVIVTRAHHSLIEGNHSQARQSRFFSNFTVGNIFANVTVALVAFWYAYSRCSLKLSSTSIIALKDLIGCSERIVCLLTSTFTAFFFLRFVIKGILVFSITKVSSAFWSPDFNAFTASIS